MDGKEQLRIYSRDSQAVEAIRIFAGGDELNTPVYYFRKFRLKTILGQKWLYLLTLTCFFVASCSSIGMQIPEIVDNGQAHPSEYFPADGGCDRPYADSSIWNTLIDWSIARIHPDSEKMMDAFWNGTPWIGSDPSQFASNVYFVNETTRLVPVKLRKNRFRDAFNDIEIQYGEPASEIMVPIPTDAQSAPGTDGQIVIINTDTGEEWGMNEGEIDSSGKWLASGAYRYHIRNSGIPPLGFGQRGAGIGQFAGIVRACEVERGSIEHAVTLAYDFPCAPDVCRANGWPEVIPPFTKTDGEGTSKYDIPEGARIVIRPDISLERITKACSGIKGCIVWVVAMQTYGGFIVDKSGHPKTYPEGNATAHWDPQIWSRDMLRNIPREWYDVVDWNFPVAALR